MHIIPKDRMLALSDGIIAIIITILALELKTPIAGDWGGIKPLATVFLAYVLSFVYLGIYWNAHHYLSTTFTRVNAAVLWANLHLMLWLGMIPFASAFLGEYRLTTVPVIVYGAILSMCAVAFRILESTIVRMQGKGSTLRRAIGRDWKGLIAVVAYAGGMILASSGFAFLGLIVYALIAVAWIVPDARIARLPE